MLYTLRFFSSSKCSLFHNSNVFASCIIHILYTGCAKIKKKNSGAESLILRLLSHAPCVFPLRISEDYSVRKYITKIISFYWEFSFVHINYKL